MTAVSAEAVDDVGELGGEVGPGDRGHDEEEDQKSGDDQSRQAEGIDELTEPGLLQSF